MVGVHVVGYDTSKTKMGPLYNQRRRPNRFNRLRVCRRRAPAPSNVYFPPLRFCSRKRTLRLTVTGHVSAGGAGAARAQGNRTNGIVLDHAERAVCSGAHERLVVAGQRHADEAHSDGAGLCCARGALACVRSAQSRPAAAVPFLAIMGEGGGARRGGAGMAVRGRARVWQGWRRRAGGRAGGGCGRRGRYPGDGAGKCKGRRRAAAAGMGRCIMRRAG